MMRDDKYFKVVLQIPYDEGTWDEEWADSLRIETKGNHNGPHMKIYPNQTDHETGKKSYVYSLQA